MGLSKEDLATLRLTQDDINHMANGYNTAAYEWSIDYLKSFARIQRLVAAGIEKEEFKIVDFVNCIMALSHSKDQETKSSAATLLSHLMHSYMWGLKENQELLDKLRGYEDPLRELMERGK